MLRALRRWRRGTVAVLAPVLLVIGSGCGATAPPSTEPPSKPKPDAGKEDGAGKDKGKDKAKGKQGPEDDPG